MYLVPIMFQTCSLLILAEEITKIKKAKTN